MTAVAAATATEETLAEDIGKALSGATGASVSAPSGEDEESSSKKYEFNRGFQTTIAAFVMRDVSFNEQTVGLIKPDYFEDQAEAILVSLSLKYFDKYRKLPSTKVFIELMGVAIKSKIIRSDTKDAVLDKFRELTVEGVSDREYVVEVTAEFARHQAMERAILASVDLLEKRKFSRIEEAMKQALLVGSQESSEYDYFEEIDSRTEERNDFLKGRLPPTGITTGIAQIDSLLYHRGWGRKELSIYMGGAKAGKTVALINSSISAVCAGYNVLHVTLEVSKEIVASRADANISDVIMAELRTSPEKVRDAIRALKKEGKVGEFKLHEYGSGTMTPAELHRLIQSYKAKGIIFDLVVVDYLDIMAPNNRTNDSIENSKMIWIDCRAIAQEENVAMLSATQTNRDGFKAQIAKAEHAADDFNKIRTADIVISINRTQEELLKNEARLYFAASRNQAMGFSVHVRQNIEKMQFVTDVIGVE